MIVGGADANAADGGGNTALTGGCFIGLSDIDHLLIEHGTDVIARPG